MEFRFSRHLCLSLRDQRILQVHQSFLVTGLAHLINLFCMFLRQRLESIVQTHLVHLLFHAQQGGIIVHLSGHNIELATG